MTLLNRRKQLQKETLFALNCKGLLKVIGSVGNYFGANIFEIVKKKFAKVIFDIRNSNYLT